MSVRASHGAFSNSPPSPLCQRTLQHTDQVLGLARDLVPRGSSPQPLWKGQNHHQQQQQLSRPSTPRGPSIQRGQPTTQQDISRGDARPATSPLRSYAKGKNSLWLLNSESYSSVTMKMLIEKQAAAAARLNSPSRLEAFAADSPPRQRTAKSARPGGTANVARTRALAARSGGSGGGGGAASPPWQTNSGGGVSLAHLVSATTPPRRGVGIPPEGFSVGLDGAREDAAARRSLAQETYTKTFSGMQAYGESGMTVLEELIDAAFRACDMGHAQGQQRVTGAAALTHSGKIYSGYNVESASVDLSVGAERTTVLKAVSEGETRFRSLVMASDTDQAFPSPDGPGRQFLAEFGEFPIYLVNREMQVKIVSTAELYPMMPPDPHGGGLGPCRARDEAIVAASRERQRRPPRDWGVQEVLDWLEDKLELGEYRRAFSRAKVDGALLLNLEDKDLQNMLGIAHPLHRRRICLGIQKIKDAEADEMGKDCADMNDYVQDLDRDRISLIAKMKVIFDRFDRGGAGRISASDARAALEYMGRDVTGEACASWLADHDRNERGITFVDFTTAYSALFVDEDPDVHLGHGSPKLRKPGVSITGSGHVRLDPKNAQGGAGNGRIGAIETRGTNDERVLWAGSNSETEEEGSRTGRRSPRKVRSAAENDRDTQAFEALRSVKKLAEVKQVFDRFAVDGMLTANEALQALTEAGCTAPRTHAGRYLRSRRFFGLRREVTFFEFLRSMAALGVHDSGAHVTGFAPSMLREQSAEWNPPASHRRDKSSGRAGQTVRGRRNRYGRDRQTDRSGSSTNSSGNDSEDVTATEYDDGTSDDLARHRKRGGTKRGRSPRRDDSSSAATMLTGRNSGGTSARRRSGPSSSKRIDASHGRSPRRKATSVYGRDLAERRSRGRTSCESSEQSEESRRGAAQGRGRGEKTRSRSREGDRPYSRRSRDRDHGGSSESVVASGSDESAFGHRQGRGRQDNYADRNRRSDGPTDGERNRSNCEREGRERHKGRDREHTDNDRSRDRERARGRDKYEDSDRGSGGARGRDDSRGSRAKEVVGRSSDDECRALQEARQSGRLRTGDRVEARYRGKGTKFYKGNIVRLNSDATFDIDYDDGEKELGIAEEHVRSLDVPIGREREGAARGKLSKGYLVEVRYRGKGTKYYKGKIAGVNSDGTVDISYDDGDKEVGIAEEHVRLLQPFAGRDRERGQAEDSMQEGDEVEVNYRGRGRYHKGRISRANLDKTFNIDYDDGEKERDVAKDMIRVGKSRAESSTRRVAEEHRRGNSLKRGDKVEARYRGRGTKFYKGKISRVNSDATFDIHYDDGEKELGLAEEHIRSLESESRDGAREGHKETSALQEGDKIEGNYRGRGRYCRGRVSRVNLDGTFNIEYDDGKQERGVTDDMIRHVNSERPREKEHTTLKRGDRVEARYRGRGAKFYKGKISRVNSDGTFDIAYDDGERELGIAEEHVTSLEPALSRDVGKRADGQNLSKGDEVEARYRGRGTKFYKGKIARVNPDGTFDINYDDGEKDLGITTEDVKPLETMTCGRESGGRSNLEKGDKVEARYRGRGTKFYKGKITRVNSDGTFDISYDDGEKELGIAEEHVKPLDNASSGRQVGGRNNMGKGDRVEARYRGRGTKFYKGTISRVNSDGTFDVKYDDGEKELGIAEKHVKSLDAVSGQGSREGSKLEKGGRVEARYRGRGIKFYKGKITRVNSDGTFDINYDDGEKELGISEEHIKSLEPTSSEQERGVCGSIEKGDKVEARYRGRGTKFYKGKIVRVNSNATFDIAYDDGEKEIGLAEEHIRRLGSERTGRRDVGDDGALTEGDKVEGNYRGRGKYYKGRISRVNLDGTFNLDYDDGEKERGIPKEMIRALYNAGTRSDRVGGGGGGDGKLRKGDKVDARYQGKGTKFYKGTIARIRSDGTVDVEYDDGEKERSLAEEHIRPLEPERVERKGRECDLALQEGDKVEANYRGRGRYYKGRINRVNRDGTFDVDYDDGEKELGIEKDMMRVSAEDKGSRNERRMQLMKGDAVEARYRGRGTKFYKGTIARANADGTFDIDYDDGEKERGIAEEHVRSLGKEATHGRESRLKDDMIREGDKVEGNYRGRGRYYKGRVARIHRDGTFDIDYDDGEKERNVNADMIRALANSPSSNRGPTRPTNSRDSDPSLVKRGDRVEARYRGKGTKFYKGKIVRVNSDATFDIDYDDGEKEVGLAEDHVRSLESGSRAEASENRKETGVLQEGEKIEGNYRGRGRYFKGRISRANLDGTFNIEYDDGEKERGVTDDMIRPLDRGMSPSSRLRIAAGSVAASSRGGGETLEKGDTVEARYRGKGTKFYKGTIVRVNSDATFDINYEDGDKERSIAEKHVRSLKSANGSTRDTSTSGRVNMRLDDGDTVEANYRGKGRYYKGRINRANSDGTFDINYDDGEREGGVSRGMVHSIKDRDSDAPRRDDRRVDKEPNPGSRGGRAGGSTRQQKGDKVEARYRGRGTKFYKGRIIRVNSDDTFDIDYDDGEKEVGIAEEHVRILDPLPQRGARKGAAVLAEGDRVEGNYRGQGRYYKGNISRCNLDGTFNIDYDDGEKERGVTDDLVRVVDGVCSESPARSNRRGVVDSGGVGSAGSLRRGDNVEARYRGRGTKFYKGRIARVNSDATYDIDYDDGEKEVGIAEEHVRQVY